MTTLYCDCFSGISGDMFLGALLDAGLPVEHLAEQFGLLDLPEFHGVGARKVMKGALAATLLDLDIEEHTHAHEHTHDHVHAGDPEHSHSHEHDHEPDSHAGAEAHVHAHDHEHDHVHEHDHDHDHDHVHEHDHEHDHNHDHVHDHDHAHSHHHRNLSVITDLIMASGLSDAVKQTSLKIFQKLAEAEAKVHGTSIDEVHFHEVGAVDSILDIVGAAVGLNYFGIDAVYASALPLGSGQVNTAHGLLPIPAPATAELIRMAQAPVAPSTATVELVTPTGAAILAALAEFRQPTMRVTATGIGAGRREMPWPNVLRVMIGTADGAQETHIEIETNIDDMNPQVYGHVMSRLFDAGALDVYTTPIVMKKNRPATKLSVIARKSDEDRLCDLLLRETSTLGVRVTAFHRHEAAREFRDVETPYGPVPVKLKILEGTVVQATPEFDVCGRLAEEHGVPVLQVIREAEALANARYLSRL